MSSALSVCGHVFIQATPSVDAWITTVTLTLWLVCVLLDALPAALQSPGEAASSEVVHAHGRAREEKDHQGHDLHGVGTATAFLQLPALERPEDYLQEVGAAPTCLRNQLRLLSLLVNQQEPPYLPTAVYMTYNSSVYFYHLKVITVFKFFSQVCQLVFLLGHRGPGERAVRPGGYSSLRGAAGQILWQCTSLCFTLFYPLCNRDA